jgi:hypothetical protein
MKKISAATADKLFAYARGVLVEGRASEAVAVARAAAIASTGVGPSVQFAELLAMAGCPKQAGRQLKWLSAFSARLPASALAHVAMHSGRINEAVQLLESHLARHPGDSHLHYELASLLPHLGRFAEANAHAARCPLVPCGDLQPTCCRVIRFPVSLPQTRLEPPAQFQRRVSYDAASDFPDAEVVYLVGCDSRYFQLFGEALTNSLARRSGLPLVLHFHLINPDATAETLLARLRAQSAVPVACSRETVALADLNERQRRTYLSCARYLVLPDILERYGRWLIVADADQLVVRNLTPFMHELTDHDVGLLRDDRNVGNILSLVSASVLAVSPTPGGRLFARTLRDVLAERTNDPLALSWHLDQAALAVTHLWLPDIRTRRLPIWIMDSVIDPMAPPDMLDPRSLFWSITFTHKHNARKLDTSLFRDFLDDAKVAT